MQQDPKNIIKPNRGSYSMKDWLALAKPENHSPGLVCLLYSKTPNNNSLQDLIPLLLVRIFYVSSAGRWIVDSFLPSSSEVRNSENIRSISEPELVTAIYGVHPEILAVC